MQFVVRHICRIDNRLRACFSRQRPEKLGGLPLILKVSQARVKCQASMSPVYGELLVPHNSPVRCLRG